METATASVGAAEGVEVGSKYRLGTLLAVSGRQADFETIYRGGAAMIRVFHCGSEGEAKMLAAGFLLAFNSPHQHLLNVYDFGEGLLEGEQIAWIVMERADECLANVVRERPLSEEEVAQLIQDIRPALEFLHEKKLGHRYVQASNIYACGEEIKLSSDWIGWADSMETVETQLARLTQEVTPVLPQLLPQSGPGEAREDHRRAEPALSFSGYGAESPKYRRYAALALGGVVAAAGLCTLLIRSAHQDSVVPAVKPAVVEAAVATKPVIEKSVAIEMPAVPKGWAVVAAWFDQADSAEKQAASLAKAHRRLHARVYASDQTDSRFVIALASGLSEAQARRQLTRLRRSGAPRSSSVVRFGP